MIALARANTSATQFPIQTLSQSSVSAKAYAVEPAKVGMARNPTPTIPRLNRVAAKLPAKGRRASAAWREVSIFVMPCRLRVMAVVRIMKNMTIFEKNAPYTHVDFS